MTYIVQIIAQNSVRVVEAPTKPEDAATNDLRISGTAMVPKDQVILTDSTGMAMIAGPFTTVLRASEVTLSPKGYYTVVSEDGVQSKLYPNPNIIITVTDESEFLPQAEEAEEAEEEEEEIEEKPAKRTKKVVEPDPEEEEEEDFVPPKRKAKPAASKKKVVEPDPEEDEDDEEEEEFIPPKRNAKAAAKPAASKKKVVEPDEDDDEEDEEEDDELPVRAKPAAKSARKPVRTASIDFDDED
jgi:hypothetical protein